MLTDFMSGEVNYGRHFTAQEVWDRERTEAEDRAQCFTGVAPFREAYSITTGPRTVHVLCEHRYSHIYTQQEFLELPYVRGLLLRND